jgi:2-polyprenyl-3-methyl-5-hydroxy-6-metoxy-1,4-benzoquinol methylase
MNTDSETLKELVFIVASRANKDINKIKISGDNFAKKFSELGILKPNMKILDYGAGVGRMAIPFNRIANVTAIDGNPKMVKYLTENGILAFCGDDCTSVINKTFDFAMSMYVLQHIHFPKSQEIVRQISKITSTFYFTYPIIEMNAPESYMHYTDSYDIDVLESHHYSRKMSEKDLPKLFEKSQFNSNTIKNIFDNVFEIKKN